MSEIVANLRSAERASIVWHADAWVSLADRIREFDADVVVLVARKMPRLMEALHLDLGLNAICVSDQAIPFVYRELRNARVAIVDDVWNVGTTMLRSRDKVNAAMPRTVRLFALGARNADEARKSGVSLTLVRSLSEYDYKPLVDSVPRALKLMPKPYDVDFPIVACLLHAPFRTWGDCWSSLKDRFGDYVHSTTDSEQLLAGFARASIHVSKEAGWTCKARLYFDFKAGRCNVVPLALASGLPLENDYPAESFTQAVFDALQAPLHENADLAKNDRAGFLNASARVKTFCDSLLFADLVLGSLNGLVQRETMDPFSLDDLSVQFGPTAARNCTQNFKHEFREVNTNAIQHYVCRRRELPPSESCGLLSDERIVGTARKLLRQGLPALALDALFTDLSRWVGADDPSTYALEKPYTKDEIDHDPYLRLRVGFTFQEFVQLFRSELNCRWIGSHQVELLVSALADEFIDDGAIVPTFTLHGEQSARIYRKGEAHPRWDEELARLKYAIDMLNEKDRQELIGRGRTRIAKINAILSMSHAADGSALTPGALERGTVGMLTRSVVERQDGELTGLMRRLGLLG